MPYKDLEKRRTYLREWQRGWRERNREKHRASSRDYYHKHKQLFLEKAAKWRKANPEKHAQNFRTWFYEVKIQKQYGISCEQFEALLAKQNYCCAICRNPFVSTRNRHIDHCHDTNTVRGILCHKCNLAIGLLQHSPTVALEAAHYLNAAPNLTTAQPAS